MKPFFNDISSFLPKPRQIGRINFAAFWVFLTDLSALFCHCESQIYGKMDLVVFPAKKLWFSRLTHIYPEYDIGRKEFCIYIVITRLLFVLITVPNFVRSLVFKCSRK